MIVGVLLGLAHALNAAAVEPGASVAARRGATLRSSGVVVDRVGPGQVLQVLSAEGNRLWVSRGRPGWIDATDVIALDEAEALFSRAIAAGAASRDYLARGMVRVGLERYAEGIADLEMALQIAPDRQGLLEPLGFAQIAAGDLAAAIETFSEALAADADSAPALMGRGLAFYKAGQTRQAHHDFYRAIGIEPEHAFPRKYLGALLHDLGDRKHAREQLAYAAQLDAFDAFTRKALGRLLFDEGDYESALQQFTVAVRLDSNDPEARTGCGVARHALGRDLAAAEADFAAAVRLAEPSMEYAHLWSNMGQVQMERGRFEQALQNLSTAIALDPRFNEARSHRAYLLAVQRPSEASAMALAKQDLRAVFASPEPKTFWDYRALATANAALGDFRRAAKYQTLAVAALRASGPERFLQEAESDLEHYGQGKPAD